MSSQAVRVIVFSLLAAPALLAQEPPASRRGALLERFRQLDADVDGKLSRTEGRALPNFEEMDADGDGFLTPQEIGTFYGPKRSPVPPERLDRRRIEEDRTPRYASPDGFVPEDVPVGDPDVGYTDPEFLPGGRRMVFVDEARRVWVAELDPETGLTRSRTGKDLLVGEGLAPFKDAQNGPEWCLDRGGASVAFTVLDEKRVPQLALARVGTASAGPVRLLTRGPQRNFSPFGTLSSGDESAWLAFGHGGVAYADYHVKVLDVAHPERTLDLPYYWIGSSAPRWLHGTTRIVYPRLVKGDPIAVEIAVLDVATGEARVLTDDGGRKDEVFGFFAPEYGGEVLYAAQVDNREIAVYRDLGDRGGLLTRVATLRLPPDCPHPYLRSMEPLVDQRGAGGVSCFTVLAAPVPETYTRTDTSIWILGLGTDPGKRVVRRVDEGGATGKKDYRYEPETSSGPGGVFVYYTVDEVRGGRPVHDRLRRCRTGIVSPAAGK